MRRVFSLNLICYLQCKGYKEHDVGMNENTKKIYYLYKDDNGLDEAIQEYKSTGVMINLHKFISEFKKVKEDIYNHTQRLKT